MINRAIAPAAHTLVKPKLLEPTLYNAANGCPLYVFNAQGSQVLHVEWVFAGGLVKQHKPIVAGFTAQLLTEGTESYSSEKISGEIDFYGAQVQMETESDQQIFSVSCTKESLPALAGIIHEIMTKPLFTEKEFELQLNTSRERFKVNRKKVDYVSRLHMNAALYGPNHILGHILDDADYDNLTTADLKTFFSKHIQGNLNHVVAAGDVDTATLNQIMQLTNNLPYTVQKDITPIAVELSSTKKEFIPVADAVQSSIRIVYKGIPRQHPDFPALQVVNMILGGYFGSRLMSNIREDKGYTYGIGSSVLAFKESGYISISTEVGAAVTADALTEIYREINRMYTEPVPVQELELARNYLVGSFIRNSDGVFAMAERFKSIAYSGLGYDYYDYYFKVIENITAEEIMAVSKKYFDRPFIEVVAGGGQ